MRLWEPHEATVNLTARLDLLDAKYVNATITHLARILHQKPEYEQVTLCCGPKHWESSPTQQWRWQ